MEGRNESPRDRGGGVGFVGFERWANCGGSGGRNVGADMGGAGCGAHCAACERSAMSLLGGKASMSAHTPAAASRFLCWTLLPPSEPLRPG